MCPAFYSIFFLVSLKTPIASVQLEIKSGMPKEDKFKDSCPASSF